MAAIASKPSSGDLSWCHSTGHSRARCDTIAFGPKRLSRSAAAAGGQAGPA